MYLPACRIGDSCPSRQGSINNESDSMTTELAVHDEVEAVLVSLTEESARELDGRIRAADQQIANGVDELIDLLEEAASSNLHEALGFPTLTAYINDAVTFTNLDARDRKFMTALLSDKGVSQRAIASALGVSQPTVHRDLIERDTDESPDDEDEAAVTVGIDGKEYERPEPKQPKGDQVKTLTAAVRAITKQVTALEDAFDGVENLDADMTVDELQNGFKELSKLGTRINALKKQFAGWN